MKKILLSIVAVCVLLLLLSMLPIKHFVSALRQDQTPNESVPQNESVTNSFKIPVGDSLEHMTIDGKERTYTAYVPQRVADSTGPIDVLFVIHGTGGTGEGIREVGFDSYADAKGFVTIYPDSLTRDGVAMWDPTNREVKDLDFIQAIIAELKKLSGNQIGNIYVAGMSNGSVMTQAVGCMTAEVDGIASVSAGLTSQYFPYCKADRPMPFIGFYGTEDRFGEIGKYESSVAFFAKENGCTDTYTATALPNIDPSDGTTVDLRVYKDTSGKACSVPTHYYRIEGGGHFWPTGEREYREDRLERNTGSVSKDIDATELIVEFFGLSM